MQYELRTDLVGTNAQTVCMVEQTPIRERLKAMRDRAGYSVRALADEIGWGHSKYAAYESKRYKKPFLPPDLVELLVTPMGARGISPEEVRTLATPGSVGSDIPQTNVQFPQELHPTHAMIPILGSAEAGNGYISIQDEVGQVRVPPDLENLQGVFALYVVGDSMEPAMEHGYLIYVSPIGPSTGQFALFEMRGDDETERRVVVKRLLRTRPDHYEVKQYNPEKIYEIPRAMVFKARTISHIKPR